MLKSVLRGGPTQMWLIQAKKPQKPVGYDI